MSKWPFVERLQLGIQGIILLRHEPLHKARHHVGRHADHPHGAVKVPRLVHLIVVAGPTADALLRELLESSMTSRERSRIELK